VPTVVNPALLAHDAHGISYDRTTPIDVIWGLAPRLGNIDENTDPTSLFDMNFDATSPFVQRSMASLCDRAKASPALKVFHVASCWPQMFKKFLESERTFPSRQLHHDLPAFLRRHSIDHNHLHVELRPWRLAWLCVSFRTQFDTHSSGQQTKPFMAAWEEFVSSENAQVGPKGQIMPNAELFVRAEAEIRVISSALTSWVISLVCAMIAVFLFMRNVFLSIATTCAIFATSSCTFFAITCVFQWRFGLMEAVSLIVFCGFSVDYPLHVVHAYVLEKERGSDVKVALKEVGWAVTSGCVTTVGASVFLLFGQISIFSRFGGVLIVNMISSLLFALVWLPAFLEWRETVCARRSQAVAALVPMQDIGSERTPRFLQDRTSLSAASPDGFVRLAGHDA